MTALTIAKTDDLDRIMRLVADYHGEEGIDQSEDTRRAAILPLLEGLRTHDKFNYIPLQFKKSQSVHRVSNFLMCWGAPRV